MNIKSYRRAQIEFEMSENIRREMGRLKPLPSFGHRPKAEIDQIIARIRMANGPLKAQLASVL